MAQNDTIHTTISEAVDRTTIINMKFVIALLHNHPTHVVIETLQKQIDKLEELSDAQPKTR